MISPFSSKTWVMPTLRPMIPSMLWFLSFGPVHRVCRGPSDRGRALQGRSAGALVVPRPPASRRLGRRGLGLDLDVDAGRDVQLLQRLDGLAGRARDVDEPLVDADLELLARLLVHVRTAKDRVDRLLGRQR